jgi:hypothetical protein
VFTGKLWCNFIGEDDFAKLFAPVHLCVAVLRQWVGKIDPPRPPSSLPSLAGLGLSGTRSLFPELKFLRDPEKRMCQTCQTLLTSNFLKNIFSLTNKTN